MESAKHYKNGTSLVVEGQYGEAIVELSKSIELNPEHDDVYYNRGLAYAGIGEAAKAVADFEKCIELSDDPELVKSAQMRLDALKR